MKFLLFSQSGLSEGPWTTMLFSHTLQVCSLDSNYLLSPHPPTQSRCLLLLAAVSIGFSFSCNDQAAGGVGGLCLGALGRLEHSALVDNPLFFRPGVYGEVA